MITNWNGDELLVDDGERWVKYHLRRPSPEGLRWPIRYLVQRVARSWRKEEAALWNDWDGEANERFFEVAVVEFQAKYGAEL